MRAQHSELSLYNNDRHGNGDLRLCAVGRGAGGGAAIDHILFDIKHLDPGSHLAFTSPDNRLILANLRKLAETGKNIDKDDFMGYLCNR